MLRRRRPPPPVQRVASGFAINVGESERELLIRLLGELADVLAGGAAGHSTDPAQQPMLRRMFPPAYHLAHDNEAETEYQRLMRDELVASRLAAITTVSTSLREQAVLDDAGMNAFVQAVNMLRLVLGTLLDVDESHDLDAVADDDPLVGEHHLYGYLSYLLDAAVGVLTS